MSIRRYLLLLACELTINIGTSTASAAAEVIVVAARNSPLSRLTADQATDIFLGRIDDIPGIGRVIPIDQAEGSTAREEFYKKAAQKNPAQLKAYWSRRIFTGKGEPPAEVGSAADVKRAIATNPHMIGYIQKQALDGSVKPLLVIP